MSTGKDRLKTRAAELEEANRELETFFYSVSHNLRAPLRHISGSARLLTQYAGPQLDEQAQHYVQTMVDAAAQSGRLVDALLAFSHIGRSELKITRVDMAELVARARAEVDQDCGNRQIDWTIGALPIVMGEPAMLSLVWINLLANAVKFTRGTPRAIVEIGHERAGDEVVFHVRDNGAGFEMQNVDKLFGVFQRLHKAEEFEGTGIGLVNVRRIVGRLGGRTWAEGAPGQGATFFFSLPDRDHPR